MDDTPRLALPDRHVHRVDDELGLEVVSHRPSDDPAAEGVQDDRQIQESGPSRHIGDVRYPEHVRLMGIEVPVDQIAGRPQPFVADRGSRSPAAADALQACGFHQSFDTLSTDVDAGISQFSVDARRAVDLPGGLVDGLDASGQITIGH